MFKIQSMTYANNMEMLSVGLSNGQIVNYTFDIESYVYQQGDDTRVSPTSVPVDQRGACKCTCEL